MLWASGPATYGSPVKRGAASGERENLEKPILPRRGHKGEVEMLTWDVEQTENVRNSLGCKAKEVACSQPRPKALHEKESPSCTASSPIAYRGPGAMQDSLSQNAGRFRESKLSSPLDEKHSHGSLMK